MRVILFIKATRKSIQARFPSSLVISRYLRSENSSSGCSQLNSRTQYGCWDLLHIEKVFIKAIGDWVENSGWTEVYNYVNINSNGRADSFLKCSGDAGIKRSHYAHQLTLTPLEALANEAFKWRTGYTDFKAWKANLEKKCATSKY